MKTVLRWSGATIAAIWCVFMIAIEMGCEQNAKNKVQIEASQPMKNIDEVIRAYDDSLLAIPGVVGVYHGLDEDGKSCLKVMVKQKTPEIVKRIPRQIEGYSVVIDETGEIRPMQ